MPANQQYQSNYSDDDEDENDTDLKDMTNNINENDTDLKDMRAVGEKVSDDRQTWVPFLCARVVLIMREIMIMSSSDNDNDNDNDNNNDRM